MAVNVWLPYSGHGTGKVVRSYAATFGMPLPAAPNGGTGLPPVILPACLSKKQLFADYKKIGEAGIRTL